MYLDNLFQIISGLKKYIVIDCFFFKQMKYLNVMSNSQKTPGLAFIPLQHNCMSLLHVTAFDRLTNLITHSLPF